MWVPASDEHGRVYYYDTATDAVTWDNPWQLRLGEAQDVIEQLLAIRRRQGARTALRIGRAARLLRAMQRWRGASARGGRVRAVAGVWDAWLRTRAALAAATARLDEATEALVVQRLRSSQLTAQLATARVRTADEAFERLNAAARHRPPSEHAPRTARHPP